MQRDRARQEAAAEASPASAGQPAPEIGFGIRALDGGTE